MSRHDYIGSIPNLEHQSQVFMDDFLVALENEKPLLTEKLKDILRQDGSTSKTENLKLGVYRLFPKSWVLWGIDYITAPNVYGYQNGRGPILVPLNIRCCNII